MDEPSPKDDLAENSRLEIARVASRQQAERTNPSIAPNMSGLASRLQRAEMRVILAGKWPALKPLPVFKYEAGEYRAAIEFDKLRGEWVCRKISFPSNKIQEMRGGLAEITQALPRGGVEAIAEDGDVDHLEQETERDAVRRAQVMREWREKSEGGALYAELEGYLSGGQREEVYESIRLTLTARQLQVLPKNVAYVFEALSKAGGKLATLVELAQRKKAGMGGELEEPARGFAPEPARAFAASAGEGLAAGPLGNVNFGTVDQIAGIGSGLPERVPIAMPEPILEAEPEESGIVKHALPEESASEVGEGVAVRESRRGAFGSFGGQGRAEVGAVAGHEEGSRGYVLEISGLHVAAFSGVILLLVISLVAGFTLGGGPIGKQLRDAERAILNAEARPAAASGEAETSAPGPLEAKKTETKAPAEEKSEGSGALAEAGKKAGDKETNTDAVVAPKTPEAESTERGEKTESAKRSAAARGIARSGRDGRGAIVAPAKTEARKTAARWEAPAKIAGLPLTTGTAILVRGPGDGSKAFRLTLPEKTIAASSTFAMSAQLSVMVAPEPGVAAVHEPNRLQAGGIVSFVWPHYSKPRDKSGSAETVKVRTTIGKYGEVEEVKLVSGSSTFFAAAMSAIRQWRFKPTLLNERPVQAQEDVTIEYRR